MLSKKQRHVRKTILRVISRATGIYDRHLLHLKLGELGSELREVMSVIILRLGAMGKKLFYAQKAEGSSTVLEFIQYVEKVVFEPLPA